MSTLFWLSEEQFEKIKPLLPDDVCGVPRVDARRVLSGIIHVIKHGLHWSDGADKLSRNGHDKPRSDRLHVAAAADAQAASAQARKMRRPGREIR